MSPRAESPANWDDNGIARKRSMLLSCSLSAAKAVSCAAEAEFVTGARGGDDSRDATRRTWRDEVSDHGAARRITVAQQPASTPPDFVVARQRKTCQQNPVEKIASA